MALPRQPPQSAARPLLNPWGPGKRKNGGTSFSAITVRNHTLGFSQLGYHRHIGGQMRRRDQILRCADVKLTAPNGTGAVATPRPQMQEPRDVMATPRGPRSLQREPIYKDAQRATVRRPGPSPGPLGYSNRSMGISHRAKVHRAFCSASISRFISTAINPGKASATANRASVIIAIMINLPCGWARGDSRAS